LISIKEFEEECSVEEWEEVKGSIYKSQKKIDTNLEKYGNKLKVF
jgi:hypothetical protein